MDNDANKLAGKDAYKIALDTRNLEIGLFWQRSNYFLALNTALAVGFFKIEGKGYTLLVALFGLGVSWLWFRVNLGSKFWQSRWERRLRVVEEQMAPDLKFFAADWNTIHEDVKNSLDNSHHKGLQRFIDNRILKKPSVSYQMIRLSLMFIAGWTLLSVTQVIQILELCHPHLGQT